jgi:hypothetical protein
MGNQAPKKGSECEDCWPDICDVEYLCYPAPNYNPTSKQCTECYTWEV